MHTPICAHTHTYMHAYETKGFSVSVLKSLVRHYAIHKETPGSYYMSIYVKHCFLNDVRQSHHYTDLMYSSLFSSVRGIFAPSGFSSRCEK